MSTITVSEEKTLVEVEAWPDEVQVTVSAPDGNLTPDQARQMAAMLIEAADKCTSLDWIEDEEAEGGLRLVERAAA